MNSVKAHYLATAAYIFLVDVPSQCSHHLGYCTVYMLCSMYWVVPLAVLLGDETKTNYTTAVAVLS